MKALVTWIEGALEGRVSQLAAVAGGDINQAHRVALEDGRVVFVKWNTQAPPGMFISEAQGLNWLRESRSVVVPEVLHYVEALPTGHRNLSALMLEDLGLNVAVDSQWECFGRQLAALHAARASGFGDLPDNFIGTLPQANSACDSWSEFWIQRRLEPQFRRAIDSGKGPTRWLEQLSTLYANTRDLIVEPRYPERVHGDLWSGNFLMSATRGPALIDPAAYGGHGEVDLAMMRLFGGFDARTFHAYIETRGNAYGLEERLKLYQLYPLLVHVNLFGGSYVASVEALLRHFA